MKTKFRAFALRGYCFYGRLLHYATLVGKLCDTDRNTGLDIFGDYFCNGIRDCTMRGVAGVSIEYRKSFGGSEIRIRP
jgi:hypothetical protein